MLRLNYANCLSDRVGSHGLDPARLDLANGPAKGVADFTRKLASTRGTGWERWRELASGPMREAHVAAINPIVERCRSRFDQMVVLGIGGSALGNIAVHAALNAPTYNLLPDDQRRGPRLFVIDNVDPANFEAVMGYITSIDPSLERTLFNVISKSGETAETAAQFMIIRDLLAHHRKDKAHEHVVAITDAEKGTMRKICDEAGYETLPVPDGVGGRFSVLSPVGLFSAAMCGIDIDALLDGAAEMDGPCSRESLCENPAAMLGFLLVELGTRKGKPNHVMMPYANSLYSMADWYRQLWAESLGKRVDIAGDTVYSGFTPIKALGATDQHSQVQLYREGPNDKVIGFLSVDDFGTDTTIPAGLGVESLAYLEGRSLGQLLAAEKQATEFALIESQRPNYTITFPRVDEQHIGAFICLWQVATAYAGLLLSIDAYDQPAVELGKKATFGLMGREGFEDFKASVDGVLSGSDREVG